MHLSSSAHNCPLCCTSGSSLVLKNHSCSGILTQGGTQGKTQIRRALWTYFCTSTLYLLNLLCIFYSFLPSRRRLNALREVTPVDLPNCNLVKGVGMYIDEEEPDFKCKDIISLYILLMLQFSLVQNYNTESGV